MGLACLVSELVRVGLVQAEFVHLKRISTMSSPLVLAFDLSEMVAQVLFSAKTKGAEGIVVLRAALLLFARRCCDKRKGAPGLRAAPPSDDECRLAAESVARAVSLYLTAAVAMNIIPVVVIESQIDPNSAHPKADLARKRGQRRAVADAECFRCWLRWSDRSPGCTQSVEGEALDLLPNTSGLRSDTFFIDAIRTQTSILGVPVLEPASCCRVEHIAIEFDAMVHRLLLEGTIDGVFSADQDIVARVVLDHELWLRETPPVVVRSLAPRSLDHHVDAVLRPRAAGSAAPLFMSRERCTEGFRVLSSYMRTDYSATSCRIGPRTLAGVLIGDASSLERVRAADAMVAGGGAFKDIVERKRRLNERGFSPCDLSDINEGDMNWSMLKEARNKHE